MSSQRYERVSRRLLPYMTPPVTVQPTDTAAFSQIAARDADDDDHTHSDSAVAQSPNPVPDSPPPSFRSRASSRRPSQSDQQNRSEEERNLHDAFDAPSDDESDDENNADQRRLIHHTPSRSPSQGSAASASQEEGTGRPAPQRAVTQIPVFTPAASAPGGRVYGGGNASDGVWANLNAKPRAGDDVEEKPPTYEQAAADATPPYWETTVLSPFSHTGDPNDVFVDGLLVGSFFSFIWNALISMSFQLIGFLLTYLLHTTHAAKHGSRAGLGITLVQYGFQMRYAASGSVSEPGPPNVPTDGVPDHPDSHDFDPNHVSGSGGSGAHGNAITTADWLSYVLMIVGWFILIRAVSDFMRARKQEALVRSSPDRGLGVAVVAEGESPERSV